MPVGCRAITSFAWLLYPTHDPAQRVTFGPYALDLVVDGKPAAEDMSVVVVSHGNGGTPWSHRGTAVHLAREGFAVLMLEHPGNNRHDNSLGSPTGRVKPSLLQQRPRDVSLAFDAALADSLVGPRLARDGFAILGESIGGYTALAVAGGRAMTIPEDAPPDADLAALAFPVATERDRRVRAAVLLVPAVDFFMADGALADVEIPLLVRTGALDPLCPAAKVARALRSLPDPAQASCTDVPGAGHFSFQTPYPPALAHIPPAQDPPGFDRAGYQPVLHADITAFLRRR